MSQDEDHDLRRSRYRRGMRMTMDAPREIHGQV